MKHDAMPTPSRKLRGEYYLTPEEKPLFSEIYKQPYWVVDGTTKAGKRIREKRFETYEAARLFRNTLEEADKNNGENGREVIVTDSLTADQCRDAARAYAQFPLGTDKRPDPRYTLEGAVRFALKLGFDPTWEDWTIRPLIIGPAGFLKDVERRKLLPLADEDRLTSDGSKNLKYATKVMLWIYGSLLWLLNDIIDIAALATRLKEAQRPIDKWLTAQLPPSIQATLKSFPLRDGNAVALQMALCRALNKIAYKDPVYTEERFAGIQLRPEVSNLLARTPEQEDGLLLKRLLLEDAYPGQLRKRDLYGDVQLLTFMDPDHQKRVISSSLLSVHMARKITSASSSFLKWLRHTHGVSSAPVYMPGKPKKGMPAIMPFSMQQAFLDHGWDTDWACRVIKLMFLALRPSESRDARGYFSDDLKTYHVPDESKTGWRDVEVLPIARILLNILKAEGRFEDKAPRSDAALSRFLAEVGFRSSPRALARRILGKKLTKDTPDNLIADCAEQFRKVYPELFENYVKDYPRHTAISARATSSENPDTTATWAGNSAKEVKESYWGRMAVEETIQHYRRIPTQLRGKLDPTTVALPSWFNRQTLEQAAKEQAHVNEKVTEVTSVTNGASTRRPHLAPAR